MNSNNNLEIERKYICKYIPSYFKSKDVQMGYFRNPDNVAIRVVLTTTLVGEDPGKQVGILTFKGPGSLVRKEYETKIDPNMAKSMLDNLTCGKIHKTRYYFQDYDLIWEIDKYHGNNEGLLIAEVELKSVEQKFNFPDFIGQEVTEVQKYYNAVLAFNPYCAWK
ncbi:MAG: hypothetical protein LC122_12130 [Chitinophagales bacterium]|nr:hypothetical protein [Chitinophagales bacterium]